MPCGDLKRRIPPFPLPLFSLPWLKSCEGACMLWQAGPVVAPQLRAAASCGMGALKGSRTWAVGRKDHHRG